MIKLPPIDDQMKFVFEESTKTNIQTLKNNLNAERLRLEFDEANYPKTHLKRNHAGWEAPHYDIVRAYFKQFKANSPYDTDEKIAHYLGLSGFRMIQKYMSGERKVTYHIWRKFLIATGRVPQDVQEVFFYAY